MISQINHKRTRSQFQKGMTLEQYLRGMDVNQETIPTADSNVHQQEIEEESLYRTSFLGNQSNINQKQGYIRQILQQNFQDSLDQYRQCINIVSTNLKPLHKKQLPESLFTDDHKKTYRIRNGKSMSPYQLSIKQQNKKTISPYKTYIKKFYNSDQQHKNMQQNVNKQSNKISMVRTLYGKQFQLRRSTKNIKVQPIGNGYGNGSGVGNGSGNGSGSQGYYLKKDEQFGRACQNQFGDKQRGYGRNQGEIQKFDVRIQTLKDRLQMKRKNKSKV